MRQAILAAAAAALAAATAAAAAAAAAAEATVERGPLLPVLTLASLDILPYHIF